MDAPTKEDVQKLIVSYYKEHLAQGTQVDVSVGEITEADDGSHLVNAAVKFLRKASGDEYETKIKVPFREGALDWTSLTPTGAADEHDVCPGKEPAVEEKGRQPKAVPLPANNQKPKKAKPHEGGPVDYIQEPAKVGSTSESRGGDEWLKESEATAPDPDADPNDLEVQDDPTIFEETGLSDANALAALQTFRQNAEPVPGALKQALTEAVKEPEFEPTDVALLEYYGKRDSDDGLYEFKLWFTKEEARRGASDLLQLLEEVEDMREDTGNALAVSIRRQSKEDDPASSIIVALREAGELQVEWEEGHEEEYLKEAGDNAGFYHKGVQTQANEPGQPELGGGQNKPGEEQGGDTKGHSGIGKQGGAGVGKTKPVKAKKKLKGGKNEGLDEQVLAPEQAIVPGDVQKIYASYRQAKSLGRSVRARELWADLQEYITRFGLDPTQFQEVLDEQADLFTDIVTFDKGGEEEPGEEPVEEPGEEPAGELDPVIRELVQVQAENGLDTVLQVAQTLCDEKGIEWTDEMEQQIRDEFASVAGEGEPEAEELPPEEEEEPVGEEGGPPWAEEPEETESEEEEPESVRLDELASWLEDPDWIDDLNEEELTEVEPMVYAEDELEEKAKLGTGARFKALKKELGGRKDAVKDPGALAAWIGRKKHGKGKMAKMAAKGRKEASKDKNAALSIAEANEVFELGLTDEEIKALEGGSLTKKAAESLVYEPDKSKPKVTEALKAVAVRRTELKEKSENDSFLGAMANWQRIQSKKRPASPYGRVKPNVKFKGKIRIVWDDGDETWEAPGDVQSVTNPHNAMSPSGGPTKPKQVKLTKKGGEEFKMLKNLETLRRTDAGGKRFLKAVEMQAKGQKFDERLVEVLTEGWSEFSEDESLVESVEDDDHKDDEQSADDKETEAQDKPGDLTEDLDGLDEDTIEIIAEDFGDELSIWLPDITEDLETEGGE